MEQVKEEGLASVAKVDRLQHKHPSYIQTFPATSSVALPPSSTALPPSSPLAPPDASFLVLAEPTIFHPNVTMQCKICKNESMMNKIEIT